MQGTHLAILIGYFTLMIGIGVYFARKTKVATGEDFMLAGRRLPRSVLIGTMLATWVGSGTIIGGANFAYTYGPFAAMIFFAGTPVGIIVLYLAAAKVRAASRYTVPELLEARFGVATRLVAAVGILLAYVGITSYQFIGGGYVLGAVTPLDDTQGTLLVAALVILLAAGGGLFSVAYTDFLSALVIISGLVIGVPVVLAAVGGFGGLLSGLPAEAATWSGGLTPIQLLGFFLPLLLLILADQNMYQRLTAARDEGTARTSTVGFFFGSFLVTIPVALLASSAAILVPGLVERDAADTAVLSLASEGHMPTVLGGLLLAGALAFVITTGSSFILSSAGNLVYDFYVRFARRDVSETRRLWLHRGAVVVLALIALVMGTLFPTVLELQVFSYTIYGVAITPLVLAVLFWRRVTTAGAVACVVLGTAAALTWEFVLHKPNDWNSVIVALPVALIALVVVSLATGHPRSTR